MKRKTSDTLKVLLTADRCQEDAIRSRPAGVLGTGGAAARLLEVRAGACSPLMAAVQLTLLVALLSGRVYASERIGEWVRQIEVANALIDRGDLNEAQTVYTKALDDAQSAGDQVRVRVVQQNVGRLLHRKGHVREAEKAYLPRCQFRYRAGSATSDGAMFSLAASDRECSDSRTPRRGENGRDYSLRNQGQQRPGHDRNGQWHRSARRGIVGQKDGRRAWIHTRPPHDHVPGAPYLQHATARGGRH